MCGKLVKTCNIEQMDLKKNARAVCTILISNKSIQLLSYDGTVTHTILMTNNYKMNGFSLLTL